jgi:hypothetical protein
MITWHDLCVPLPLLFPWIMKFQIWFGLCSILLLLHICISRFNNFLKISPVVICVIFILPQIVKFKGSTQTRKMKVEASYNTMFTNDRRKDKAEILSCKGYMMSLSYLALQCQ